MLKKFYMYKIKIFVSVVVLLFIASNLSAQLRYRDSYNEIGVSMGATGIASDYSQLFQIGGEVNILHRIGWRNSPWTIKSNIGIPVIPNNETKAVSKLTTIGSQLEYSFLDYGFLHSGGGRYNWTPYVGVGANAINYRLSDFDPESIPENNLATENGWSFSAKAALGARFNVNPFFTLFFELNGQYVFSDNIDGNNPDPEYWMNNWNDHMLSFSIGFTHVFGY
jgi:hypothetical protein